MFKRNQFNKHSVSKSLKYVYKAIWLEVNIIGSPNSASNLAKVLILIFCRVIQEMK